MQEFTQALAYQDCHRCWSIISTKLTYDRVVYHIENLGDLGVNRLALSWCSYLFVGWLLCQLGASALADWDLIVWDGLHWLEGGYFRLESIFGQLRWFWLLLAHGRLWFGFLDSWWFCLFFRSWGRLIVRVDRWSVLRVETFDWLLGYQRRFWGVSALYRRNLCLTRSLKPSGCRGFGASLFVKRGDGARLWSIKDRFIEGTKEVTCVSSSHVGTLIPGDLVGCLFGMWIWVDCRCELFQVLGGVERWNIHVLGGVERWLVRDQFLGYLG